MTISVRLPKQGEAHVLDRMAPDDFEFDTAWLYFADQPQTERS